MVLLVAIYSWLLTVGMHVFNAFFRNGPGSFKYYVTLGIAISTTIFMQLWGKRIVSEHFGKRWELDPDLTPRQVSYAVAFLMALGFYLLWAVN